MRKRKSDDNGFFLDASGSVRNVDATHPLRDLNKKSKWKIAGVLLGVVVLLLGVVAGVGWFWVEEKQDQIHSSALNANADQGQSVFVPYEPTESESEAPTTSPSESETTSASSTPPSTSSAPVAEVAGNVENILVMGTDTRDGTKSGIGGDEGGEGRADVMILIHVPANRQNATAVSIPRDTMGYIPSCHKSDGSGVSPAQSMGQLNSSLESGPGCTVATIEQLMKVKITHFAVINFDAAISLSNAVGGVEVDLPEAINDEKTGLKLSAGKHTLKGEQALAYVRSRYGVGNGSDLGRIQNQHKFLMSLARKILSSDTLTNPQKFTRIADAVTKNLTVDDGLDSFDKMLTLARSLSGLNPDTIRFVTLPVQYWDENPNRVVPVKGAAETLYKQLR